MTIGKRLRLLSFMSLVLVTALAVLFVFTHWNQGKLNDAQKNRYDSYLLANELKMSSEDLTRLARVYVVTGDAQYEKMYWDILDVRNGKKPRADGRTVALRTLMEQAGFTTEEFSKLKEAEDNSNSLVTTETIAMNAIKGLYNDGTGNYTKQGTPDPEMARRIMHDLKYHQDKELIMKPIRDFDRLLNERTEGKVNQLLKYGNLLMILITIVSLGTGGTLFFIMMNTRAIISEIVGEIRQSSDQTANSTRQLAGVAKELSQMSTEQATSIQESVSTVSEISAMVSRSADFAVQSSQVANESQRQAENGRESVHAVLASMSDIGASNERIVQQIENSNQHLAGISKIIAEIAEKTKIINEIVFQTKLLSFNASVEAARAGEHGKGFAVVAEEVGNLAALSGKSAREITEIVDRSIETVNKTIEEISVQVGRLVSESKSKITEGTRVAEKCEHQLSEIVDVAKKVTQMVNEIKVASEEQNKGVHRISEAMSSLDRSTQKNTALATQTEASVEELQANAQQLDQVVSAIERDVGKKSRVSPSTPAYAMKTSPSKHLRRVA